MKILSLFDGMACGMIAMLSAGVHVDRYVAYEIDKWAIKSAQYNFPNIEERGDVFKADFREFQGFDFLIGGSPCTFWSIAQKNNRETEAHGLGWDLFSQFARALEEARPRFFIYENNRSMSNAIRDSIRNAFGFEEVCINSALVSAQNRSRYYWVGKRNPDGSYSKVDISQPEDRGILLKDVLDFVNLKELSANEMRYMVRSTNGKYSDRWTFAQRPMDKDKAVCLTSNLCKGVPYNVCCVPVSMVDRDKAYCLKHQSGNARDYFKKRHTQIAFTPVRIGTLPNKAKRQDYDSKQYRIYDIDSKSTCLCGQGGGIGAKTGLYALPCALVYAIPTAWDDDGNPVKAISGTDEIEYNVYKVKDNGISISILNEKTNEYETNTYPVKLPDGFYIIRKLTISECKRLQTVPAWYEFPVSYTQSLKQLGNGWTIEVISYLVKKCIGTDI